MPIANSLTMLHKVDRSAAWNEETVFMLIDRKKVRRQFDIYTAPYDLSDSKIRLKTEHTYRVADLCSRIAKSLSLSEADEDLAWLLGMLHDIGRFEQVRRYGTFVDAKSVDHAAFGADLLFGEQLIRRFVSSCEEDPLLEKAIRLHNAFLLPEDMTEREKMYAQLLRDADKIDIIRVNCEFPRSEIYNLPEEEFLVSDISDEVFQDALAMRNVLRAHRKTAADYIVGQISLTFGLVYEESRKIIQKQGYLDHIMDFNSRNPETMRRLQLIHEKVDLFLKGEQCRIGVISDTHGLLRPQVIGHLAGCDAILHGGDIDNQSLLDALSKLAPLYAVRGNCDKKWAENIPKKQNIEICGLRIFMTHRKTDIPAFIKDAKLVVFGHTHKYEVESRNGIMYLNPGSCGPGRFNLPVTMAVIHIRLDATFWIEKIEIPPNTMALSDQDEADKLVLSKDPKGLIEKVMADIDKGKGSVSIANKYGISIELTETISRMYLTHPGVNAEGILTKMGL